MSVDMVCREIVEIFDGFRKPGNPSEDMFDLIGRSVMEEKARFFVEQGKPVEFVMSAFPAKSPNYREKTLGHLPDGAEEVAFRNFSRFSEMASQAYEPGVVIRLVTDGLVFQDIVNLPDEAVRAYCDGCISMAHNQPIVFMTFLDFFMDDLTVESALRIMLDQFGQTEEQINKRISEEEDTRMLYCGLSRFMQTDIVWPADISRNQIRERSKRVGKHMLMRSEAYSDFITHRFPRSIRLSCHPSTNSGKKFSWQFIPGNEGWSTPWHNVLCIIDGNYSLKKRSEAEDALGLELVYKGDQPYYYRDSPSSADLV